MKIENRKKVSPFFVKELEEESCVERNLYLGSLDSLKKTDALVVWDSSFELEPGRGGGEKHIKKRRIRREVLVDAFLKEGRVKISMS